MNRTVMLQKLNATPEGKVLLKVLEAVGGAKNLASLIGVRRQSIDNWVYLSGRVSKAGALLIEQKLDGVTKEELRPDITDWSTPQRIHSDLIEELMKTPRGRGLVLVLARVKYSRRALSAILGLSNGGDPITTWMIRGYVPAKRVHQILEHPEFHGLSAEIIRPDLHERSY